MSETTATPGPSRGPRLARAERRSQLLDSAAELLLERGAAAITMEGVAQRAGVSKALPYAHFDNAVELLRELRDRELDRLRVRAVAATEGVDDLEAAVTAAVHAYFDVIDERGAVLVASLRGLPLDDQELTRRQNPAFFAHLFERVGMAPPLAHAVSAVFVAGVDGIIDQWVDGSLPRVTAEATFVRLVVAGARAVAADGQAGVLPLGPTPQLH